MSLLEKHRNKILLSVLFAVVVYAVLLLVSDTSKLVVQVRDFQWELLPIIVGLTLFNYALRFVKWHYYLGVVGVNNLYWFDSVLVFLAGFSMTLTPGKAGEFLKSYLVKQRVGTPVAVTSPIVLAERLTDGVALLILAASGLLIFDSPQVRFVLLLVIVIAAMIVGLVQRRALANRLMRWMQRAPLLATRMHYIQAFYSSAYSLLQFKSLAIAVGLGIVSWAGECFALALILVGLGIPFSWTLVALSAFAMGFSTLAGALLLVPGGLGVAEASIDGLLLAFGRAPWLPEGTISQPISAAATLMIRFATLWFGFLLGLLCLGIVQRRFAGSKQLMPDAGIEGV
ncbi:MAG TPA: lysylphosphatidylglycerol synthase transmembrane domain-containing protein [Anaerolineae bacterium]|nr:lysylphosphatidylglycerol synthase transmembrane domain-containing protein [Anaerolineae bacterium]